MKELVLILIISLFYLHASGQEKEWESDVIYSEKQVPFYELQDPLVTIEGNKVSTVEEWQNVRRPQIMGMFASTIYGRVPVPESPIEVEYEIQTEDKEFFDGRCTKKIVLATYSNDRGKVSMHIALFVPNNANGPVPVFIG